MFAKRRSYTTGKLQSIYIRYTRDEDEDDDDSAENLTKENAGMAQAKEFAHKVLPPRVCVKMRNKNSHLWLECHVQG